MGLMLVGQTAVAAPKPIAVYHNEAPLQFEDAQPVILDGTTLVPFRALFEALGFQVKWIDSGGVRQAIGRKDDLNIELTIDGKAAKVNDEFIPLEVPAQMLNGSTMVPLRFVAENSGYEVTFEDTGSEYVINVWGGGDDPDDSGDGSASIEPWVVKGFVKDGKGSPLEGVQVIADNMLLYNSNLIAVTDANGEYRIELPQLATTWNMSAELKRKLNGSTIQISLTPDNDNPFAGNTGAVRHFVWDSTGPRPEGCYSCSGKVLFYMADYFHPDNPDLPPPSREDVELTLVPVGPLLDGSEGETIIAHGEDSGDGFGLQDVPFARYKIAARYAPQDGEPRAMLVRVRNKGEYAESVTADFQSITSSIHHIEVEVKLGPK
ncbi:hypothetical protein DLM86_14785 [Paenibacillus flagellatus]|uniref:Copper amine oxidase-like N-terminal domain-containing protein n=2 Tax=Paenibacillus flagellatus TaxID=2211139 RepID=A0A2V5K3N7_9BACL|nr:hypothetical protein DLM86_14785 [Paenibacillus flagellatus]